MLRGRHGSVAHLDRFRPHNSTLQFREGACYRIDDSLRSAAREFQHAFALQGVQGILLDRVRAFDVYGDFVYIGPDGRRSGAGA